MHGKSRRVVSAPVNPPLRGPVLLESVRKLLRKSAVGHCFNLLSKLRPADTAVLFRHLTENEAKALFRILRERDEGLAAEVLAETMTPPEAAVDLLAGLDAKQIAQILNHIPADDAAELVSAMPEEMAEEILGLLGQKELREVEGLLHHEEETAGRIMTPHFLALREDTSVGEAIQAIQSGESLEMVFYLYVVDHHDHLIGVLSLRQLLLVGPDTKLCDIMTRDVVSVGADRDQEEVARIVQRYDLLAIPVLDPENHLIGIITIDDIIDVIRDEATEDFYRLVGTSEQERALRSPWKSAWVRMPWLFAPFLGGILASLLVSHFSYLLDKMVLLAGFMPVINGMGGNLGSQSATITVRGLATGRISPKHVGWLVFKETRTALIVGFTYGAVLVGVSGWLLDSYRLGLIIGISLCVTMLVGVTFGSLLPVLFAKFRIDPAVATGPFVTSSIDVVGIFTFFGLVSLLGFR